MRSSWFGGVVLAAAALAAGSAHGRILLNEVLVNPPGADDAREYVEIRAGAGESLAGVWLLEIEGDTTSPGVVEHALDLSALAPGANGLLLLGHGYATAVPWPAVPAETAVANLARRPSTSIENGSVSFLLVRGFTGALGTDLDANDDGALDATPWTELLDGVAWIDGASGRAYAPAVVAIAGGVLDAATRFPGDDTPGAASAWYGADVLAAGGTPDLSRAYDPTHASPNFPAPPMYAEVGALTPGAVNVPALAATGRCGDGVLDAGEACDDGNLDDGDCCTAACALVAAGTECRAAAGACDAAEACDGASAECPADARVAAGTECRAAAGACDVAESCDGASAECPADARVVAGTECRAAAGACDAAEACDGASAECPADARVVAGAECRAAAGACDAAEACDGASVACPADGAASDGVTCDDGNACTLGDRCLDGACSGDVDASCALPPFTCHKVAAAKAPRGTPPFPVFAARPDEAVADALYVHRLDLLRPMTVCGAAGAALGAGPFLSSYAAKLTKTAPRQAKPAKSAHTTESAVGRLRVRIDGVSHLLAPASVAPGSGGAPPPAGPAPASFQCYRVSVAKEPGNAFAPVAIALHDPLAGERVFDLLGPAYLCAPASLAGGPAPAPGVADHLLCHKAKLARRVPPQAKDVKLRLSVATGFGPEVLDAGALSAVCVPATRLD